MANAAVRSQASKIIPISSRAMRCPACGHPATSVRDSRPCDDGATIRRRRLCLACQHSWRTYEIRAAHDTALLGAMNRLSVVDCKLVLALIERLAGPASAGTGAAASMPTAALEIDFDA